MKSQRVDDDTNVMLVDRKTGKVVKKYGFTDGEIQRALDDYRSRKSSHSLVYTDGREVDAEAADKAGYPFFGAE